jgi:hypothetical protein
MEIETILKLYLPIKDLPVSGTFQQENHLLAENESVRRIFIMELLETKGYTLKPAETKTVVIKEAASAAPVEKKAPPKKTETEKRKEEGLDW